MNYMRKIARIEIYDTNYKSAHVYTIKAGLSNEQFKFIANTLLANHDRWRLFIGNSQREIELIEPNLKPKKMISSDVHILPVVSNKDFLETAQGFSLAYNEILSSRMAYKVEWASDALIQHIDNSKIDICEISYQHGVTDNLGNTLRRMIEQQFDYLFRNSSDPESRIYGDDYIHTSELFIGDSSSKFNPLIQKLERVSLDKKRIVFPFVSYKYSEPETKKWKPDEIPQPLIKLLGFSEKAIQVIRDYFNGELERRGVNVKKRSLGSLTKSDEAKIMEGFNSRLCPMKHAKLSHFLNRLIPMGKVDPKILKNLSLFYTRFFEQDMSDTTYMTNESLLFHAQKLNRDKRYVTDIELETLAQTWSEHCKHNIFSSPIDEIEEGLYKACIKGATEKIMQKKKVFVLLCFRIMLVLLILQKVGLLLLKLRLIIAPQP